MRKQAEFTDFGISVKVRLIELDMTQVELADMLGIKTQYLTLILTGQRSGEKYLDRIKAILALGKKTAYGGV